MLAGLGAGWACSDTTAPARPWAANQPGGPSRSLTPGSCGVSYTAITSLDDAQLADYGVPAQTDTTEVCETWTGSDYTGRIERVGSSEPVTEYSDETRTLTYASGEVAGYDASGGQTVAPEAVGPDAFDVVQATDAERQASYDDPYYAIVSTGCSTLNGTTVCGGPGAPVYSRTPSGVATAPGAASGSTSGADKFTKHGLKRPGVRAFVDDKSELAKGANGNRRFGKTQGDEETIVELDAATELMVAQETTSPRGHTKATLTWTKHKDKQTQRDIYVRDRLDVESEEVVNGNVRRSHSTVLLSNVAWGTP